MMLQAAIPPAPPPVTAPGPVTAFVLHGLPVAVQGSKRFYILGLRITGGSELLASAAAKLKAEGWASSIARLRSGETVMIVDARGRTLDDVKVAYARFQAGDFGAVTAQVSALPDPGTK